MTQDTSAPTDSSGTTYTVVLRCQSSARFLPEDGQLITLNGVAEVIGAMEVRLRTRWVDLGHEAPVPRELWAESRCKAPSLNAAISASTGVARTLASIMAFTANVQCGAPEVHLAYDSTPGHTEREFLEVFLPDEQGLPTEGRRVITSEFTAVFEALDQCAEAPRVSRALHQYELALRNWRFGGEYLTLSHLYMAVETLTKAVIRAKCSLDGIDEAELARRNAIDPDDPQRPRWRSALDVWARQTLIFQSDHVTYEAAKKASDGVEHGFLEMNEVHRHAISATAATFNYVRQTILTLLGIEEQEFSDLYTRPPRDVQSLRKMIRGTFIGDQDDFAPPGEEYPRLEWQSNVRSMSRDGDEIRIGFGEKFTVRCHPAVRFQGTAFEARRRLEPGDSALVVSDGQEIQAESALQDPDRETVRAALSRAAAFATPVGTGIGERGVTPLQSIALYRFSTQLALFEAIEVLLNDLRPAQALVLMSGLIRNTCILQLSTSDDDGAAVAIGFRLDAIRRFDTLYDDPTVTEGATRQRTALQSLAEQVGVDLPDTEPDIASAPFYVDHARDAALIDELALGDLAVEQLHLQASDKGRMFATQPSDPRLLVGAAALTIGALVYSTIALAEICDHPYDTSTAQALLELADTLSPGDDRSPADGDTEGEGRERH